MKKKIGLFIIITSIVGALIAYNFYSKIYNVNVIKDSAILIPDNASIDDVVTLINPYLKDKSSFIWVADLKKYPSLIKPGRFLLSEGMNNNDLVNMLRLGKQKPVKVTFNNQDSLEKLTGRISTQINVDSTELLNAILDTEFLNKSGFTKSNVLGMLIPNSYEFYWNTSAEKFRDKMLKEYYRFWNQERLQKAKKLNLSKNEVITLASIVQKETSKISERPTVAGLYLNRLQDGWPLQADPTIIYALKQKHGQDYIVKRVLNKDLEIESPYNTYKNTGLPPSLISMPDISSIDAVLNPKQHQYFYMCASVTNIGSHEFAKTIAQHNANARKYQKWISKQGINR